MSITPELLVRAYCAGAFPMARSADGPIEWFQPDPRAILPLEPGAFRMSRSLAKRVRSGRFRITRDQAFEQVIRACAEPREKSPGTWISEPLIQAYVALHRLGAAHSVEAWLPAEDAPQLADTKQTQPVEQVIDGRPFRLVGGLYGVSLGGAFFGESMFSRVTDASKVCLVHLVEHLRKAGFTLLDVQFTNPHLQQFGVVEIPHAAYMRKLHAAIALDVRFSDVK